MWTLGTRGVRDGSGGMFIFLLGLWAVEEVRSGRRDGEQGVYSSVNGEKQFLST